VALVMSPSMAKRFPRKAPNEALLVKDHLLPMGIRSFLPIGISSVSRDWRPKSSVNPFSSLSSLLVESQPGVAFRCSSNRTFPAF
jgi:hypothetical protein